MWNPESSFGSVFEMNFQLSTVSTFVRLCHEERSFPTQEMLQRSRSQGLHNVDDWFCHGFLGQQGVNFSMGNDGKSSNIRSCHLHCKKECHFNMTYFIAESLETPLTHWMTQTRTWTSRINLTTIPMNSDTFLNIKTSKHMPFSQHLMQHFHHNALLHVWLFGHWFPGFH